MLGYETSAEVLALDPGNFVHPDDRQAMRERSRQMIAHRQVAATLRLPGAPPDGRWLITEVHSMPIEWQERPAILGFARDITARKEMEARLVRADRLAALGTLLAGIAHEMNNPLSYVTLAIEEMADTLEARPADPAAERPAGGGAPGRPAGGRRSSGSCGPRSRPESEDRGPVRAGGGASSPPCAWSRTRSATAPG